MDNPASGGMGLRSVPMDDMDLLVVNSGRRQLTVVPASRNVPYARVKSAA